MWISSPEAMRRRAPRAGRGVPGTRGDGGELGRRSRVGCRRRRGFVLLWLAGTTVMGEKKQSVLGRNIP